MSDFDIIRANYKDIEPELIQSQSNYKIKLLYIIYEAYYITDWIIQIVSTGTDASVSEQSINCLYTDLHNAIHA